MTGNEPFKQRDSAAPVNRKSVRIIRLNEFSVNLKEQIMSTITDTNEATLQQYREASQTLGAVGVVQPVFDDEVRLSVGTVENSNPIAAVTSAVKGGANMYGACSIQTFAASTGAGGLSHTHEDASGWINYVNGFTPRNFYYQDAGVSTWEYLDPWDDWQDTFGLDAVRAFYHSGHGGMDNSGVFYAPLGSSWSTHDAWARSNQMKFANQHLRYMFWSTCFSCRVLDGQNPFKTWGNANNGLRMLFGYESTSVDAGNYGSAFWKHWNQGKSFSQAWLDASWYDISHNQAPSAFACGSSAADAANRLNTERLFIADAVSKNWYQWRWYNAAASALARREANQTLPRRIAMAHLEPRTVTSAHVRDLFSRLPLNMAAPRELSLNAGGSFLTGEGYSRVAIARDGTYDAAFGEPTVPIGTLPPFRPASQPPARSSVNSAWMAAGCSLTVCSISGKGGSPNGSGTLETPRIAETVVQYAQVINGLPVVGAGQGKVTVTLDNDRRVIGIVDSTRPVAALVDQGVSGPPSPGMTETPSVQTGAGPEDLLANAWLNRMKSFVVSGTMPRAYATVPGSFEVGYAIRENIAVLVARHEVEVDFGHGLFKRYVVEEPVV